MTRLGVLALLATSLSVVSPRLATAQWVEEPGSGWAALTIYHQATNRVFDPDGGRMGFPGRGRSVTTAAFGTVAWGLVPGVDAWAQLPVQRLWFRDPTGERSASGLGDLRLYLRGAPLRFLDLDAPVAVRVGVKLPVGDFDVGTDLLPLGDGQRDWEALLEVGRSFHPRPGYGMVWLGYRWREPSEPGWVELGNEWIIYAAAGGEVGPVTLKGAVDGWYGSPPILNGVRAKGAEREILRVSPSLQLSLGPGELEVGGRIPVAGRNLPAGAEVVLGYFVRLGGDD